MGELRERMQQALVVRGMSPRTQRVLPGSGARISQVLSPTPRHRQGVAASRLPAVSDRTAAFSPKQRAGSGDGATVFLYPHPTAAICHPTLTQANQDIAGRVQPGGGGAAAGEHDLAARAGAVEDNLWRRIAGQ